MQQLGVPADKLAANQAAAAGYSVSIPVKTELEAPAWQGKIKVKYSAELSFDATIGGDTKGPVVQSLDAAKGIGAKASKTWWQGQGSVSLKGVDINYSVDTPLGTPTITATVVEYKYGKPPIYGTLGGSWKVAVKVPDFAVDGISVHDISVNGKMGFDVAPNYVKIVADTIVEQLKKRAGNAAEVVTTDAALGFAINASLVVVAIGTLAGTFNELAKAVDEKQLLQQVNFAFNSYTTGLGKALRGESSPGSGWAAAGWKAGKKVFDDAVKKAKSLHKDWDDDQINDKVASAAGRVETSADVVKVIKRNVGQGFWDKWVDANHGYTTFLGDAKTACGICFGKGPVSDSDPDLADWKKVSKLPNFFADR
jgi:hypothetical protein